MKTNKIKSGCTFILLFITLFCKAQLSTPYYMRNEHIAKHYQLSVQDIDNYNEVLNSIESQWNIIKSSKYSVESRKDAEKKLNEEFRIKVKAIFTPAQYDKWNKNHRGNLRVRFYKEDLGMTDKQYTEYRRISNIYADTKLNIEQKNLTIVENSKQREEAFSQYSQSLHNAFSTQLADYLIYENQVLNAAMTLSNKYTIISESKALQVAILKNQHDKTREGLQVQNLNTNQLRQRRTNIEDEYEDALRNILSNEEYIIYSKNRDKLTDKKYMNTYKMSASQLSQYKELKKKLAMKQLMIKQSKIDKSAKTEKLQEVESSFEKQLQKVLTPQQYKRWDKDQSRNY